MTYETIISEVCLNMGWKVTEGELIKPIKNAIYRALMELAGDSGSLRGNINILLTIKQSTYIMPGDFYIPLEVILEQNNIAYDTVEVEYGELLRFSKTSDKEQMNDRYSGKILYAFQKTSSQPTITIYPTIDGIAHIGYEALVGEDMEITASKTPPIPRRFHLNLIDGATYYLAKRELAVIAAKGNPDLLNAYTLLVTEHRRTFEEGKRNYTVYSKKRSTPPISVPFRWYESPSDY